MTQPLRKARKLDGIEAAERPNPSTNKNDGRPEGHDLEKLQRLIGPAKKRALASRQTHSGIEDGLERITSAAPPTPTTVVVAFRAKGGIHIQKLVTHLIFLIPNTFAIN